MNEPTKPHRSLKVSQTIFLLIVSVCAGLSLGFGVNFYLQPKIARARAESGLVRTGGKPAAESWLEAIRSGNLTKAHEATTPSFRSRVDLASFQELVANHPALKTAPVIPTWTTQGGYGGITIGLDGIRFRSSPSVITLQGELRPQEGAAPEDFELVILKDANSNRLLVDQIRFEPVPVIPH